ncbi:reverse transcriptase domain-containing protein [Tanacetum coccineum]
MNKPLLANSHLLCGTRLGEERSQLRKIEKFNREKEKSEKLKELKSLLNFEGCSGSLRYSESKTIDTKEHEKRHRSRRSRSPRTSVFSRIRRERSRSPRQSYSRNSHSKYIEALSESDDSEGGHWKSRSKKKKSYREEDDLSQPWVCEEVDPFTPRIRYFDFPKTRMPSHIKTYDGSEDLEDHLKIFQAAAKTERWAMPTWCHMFNSTLTGNAMKKCIKDPIEIHNIKQREGESTEVFVKRYKLESRDVKGASECMRISEFVHGITNPEIIKRLHDKIPKTVDEMIRVTTSFLRGEVAASNHERKKTFPPWKQHEGSQKQNFKKDVSGTNKEVFFLPFGEDEGTEGPMIIEADIGGHCVHRISSSPYNRIIGRPGVKKLQAVPSTAHGMLKIPMEGGVITLKSIKLVPLECVVVSGPEGAPSATKPIIEERIKVAINPEYPEQTVMIGSTLTEEGRNKLCGLLQRNLDIFAWNPADMNGVPRHITEHRLNVQGGLDGLVIKSRTEEEIVRDIEETFKTLREINMKLNPKKYTFGVEEGMLLGYKVNSKGLKVCPDKVDVMLSLPSPKCLKDVQKLNGKLASLNRFLAKSAEKSLPFFKNLKKCTKKSDLHWTAEAKEAFKQIKQLIAELPMLTAPIEKEELIVYLAATKETVSAVLVTEREAKQMPIYFVSRALRGPELNYTTMEKLVMALVHASKHLKRYFQVHPIIVITGQPIQQILSRPEVAGMLQKWSIELGEYVIHYRPRVSVKGQILAYFIVKRPEEDSPDTPMEEEEELHEP